MSNVPVPSAPHMRGHNGGYISIAREVPGHGEAGRTGSTTTRRLRSVHRLSRFPIRDRRPFTESVASPHHADVPIRGTKPPAEPLARPGHRFVPVTRL
jgi:hypothetical protein